MSIEKGTDWFPAFRQGKEAAWRPLFDEFNKRICYFAGLIVKDDLAAEDIASLAFQKAWNSRDKIESPKHLENFLYLVTRNGCIDYLKMLRREKTIAEDWIQLHGDTQDQDSPLDLERTQARGIAAIYKALETLPGGNVIRMAYIENKSTREIAEELNITENNVYTIKKRALERLRAVLGKDLWLLFLLLFVRL